MKIYNSIDELVGRTPMVRLLRLEAALGLGAKLVAKLEFFNPAGSAKDRVAKNIIEDAEQQGLLRPGSMIIEPTSGNTGIAIAAIAGARGYRAVIVMPSNMSEERKMLIRAYGAELVETPAELGMSGAIAMAEELHQKNPDSIIAGQFTNPKNPEAHRLTTGPEIYDDTDGEINAFVAGVGTGGTLSGVGGFLKGLDSSIDIIAVEPSDSPVLSGGAAGPHGIQGIGAGFIPDTLDTSVIDGVMRVTLDEARAASRALCQHEGILAGISSGAALHAATVLAREPERRGQTVVVLLPDSGERYLSGGMFD